MRLARPLLALALAIAISPAVPSAGGLIDAGTATVVWREAFGGRAIVWGPFTFNGEMSVGADSYRGRIRTGSSNDWSWYNDTPHVIGPLAFKAKNLLGRIQGTCSGAYQSTGQLESNGILNLTCSASVNGGPTGSFVLALRFIPFIPAEIVRENLPVFYAMHQYVGIYTQQPT